jgi:predicted fused transcriptional regulator/phosphomethylpyrimidine kinase
MHSHIPNSHGGSDSGPDAKNVADAKQQGRDIRGSKGILYSKDEYSTRRKRSYKFLQVSRRKTPGHVLQNDVAVDE